MWYSHLVYLQIDIENYRVHLWKQQRKEHMRKYQNSIAVIQSISNAATQTNVHASSAQCKIYKEKEIPMRRQRQTTTTHPNTRPLPTDSMNRMLPPLKQQRSSRPLPKYAMLELTPPPLDIRSPPCVFLHGHLGLKSPEFGFLVVLLLDGGLDRHRCSLKVSM